jgi:hypothetical protein
MPVPTIALPFAIAALASLRRSILRKKNGEVGRWAGHVRRAHHVAGRDAHDGVLEAAHEGENTKKNEVLVGFDRLAEGAKRASVAGDRDRAKEERFGGEEHKKAGAFPVAAARSARKHEERSEEPAKNKK